MNALIDEKTEENAQKLAYLASQYPEHTLDKIIALFTQMANIDVNAAIWAAQELGYIKEPNAETKKLELLKPPKYWELGETIEHLQTTILYCFRKAAQRETDFEEHYIANWTAGYTAHDVLIAMRRLLGDRKIAEYHIDDWDDDGHKNTYLFYTLSENEGKFWGRKQFKEDPIEKGKPANAIEDEDQGDDRLFPGDVVETTQDPRVLGEIADEDADRHEKMQREDEVE